MLTVRNLSASYGAIQAVRDLDLEVPDGQLVALIGSNGAGKSTTLKTIAGLHRPSGGRVELAGRDVTGVPTHRLVRWRLGYVPEGRMVVAPLTVQENLDLSWVGRGVGEAEVRRREERVFELFPRLHERRSQIAGSLSGGEQQMLAIGRALMCEPVCLLLDEPSMGLAPSVVDLVFDAIREIHRSGLSILLVEQNAALALDLADHAYVLERGRVAVSGRPADIAGTPEVHEAYLG
ncbi:MAG TPA: ABC transporter ATP-binding protein [Acidimicrobiales bacterium]|jgi:branched-chain amino acid transport system ATP-binding protein